MLKTDGKVINLSINPTYFCNFRCNFCYLTPEQLADRNKLDLVDFEDRLIEITQAGYRIGTTDLYGGEVTLLPKEYLDAIHALLMKYGAKDVELITNLSSYRPEIVEDPKYGISVSYDFEHRPHHEHVMANMLKLQREFTILTLGTPEILATPAEHLVRQINLFANCANWEIKPYSSNQANQLDAPFVKFEELVKGVIMQPEKRFRFLNEMAVAGSVAGVNNSYSDDHVYITPSGRFGVLEFDLNDNEYFLELDSFDKYIDWTYEEKTRVLLNEHCGGCEYLGGCLSEHLREVKDLNQSCNGFVGLINWYKDWKK